MRKMAIVLVATVAITTTSGCGGPYYVSGSIEDFYAQKYGESPWLWGNVLVNGLYGFVHGACMFIDQFVNGYYFWFKDAQPGGDGKGSQYEHKKATSGKPMPK
jgi:hypothetical protein